jgi:hypothetical protein
MTIHMLSTIQTGQKRTPGVLYAIFCETQLEKRLHIRRLFSVAHFSYSA